MSKHHSQQIRAGSIRQRLQFLAKDSALYGGAASLSKALNLLILPILTRLFSNAEYGALDIMTVCGAIFIAFVIMGQDSAIARFYYEYEDTDTRKQIISQAILIEIILCVIVTAVAWLSAEHILGTIFNIPEYTDTFRILVLSFPFVVTVRFSSNLLRWTFARYQFITIAFGSSVAVVAFTLLFVIVFDLGMRGVFAAQIVGNAAFAALGLYFCRQHFALPRGFRFGRELLQYGFPYMVVALVPCLIPAIDRAFISRYLGLDILGAYAIGFRYAFLIILPIQAFLSAYMPFAFSIFREPTAPETYNRVLTFVVPGLALVAIALTAIAEPVIELVASARYLPGYVVVVPILMGLVVQMTAQVIGIGIDLSKKTHFHLLTQLISITASALFIWLLIEPFGILGVGCGLLLGKIAYAIAFTTFAYRVYPLRFQWKRPATVILLATAAGAMMQAVQLDTVLLQVSYRCAVMLAFSTVIWFVMLGRADRAKAVSILREYLNRTQDPKST
jgi:O-antigen/teichoic acid export membrane protein